MTPWEFVIESPEDLGPFSDLLEEWGWQSAATAVRWLIANGRWPRKVRLDVGTYLPEGKGWGTRRETLYRWFKVEGAWYTHSPYSWTANQRQLTATSKRRRHYLVDVLPKGNSTDEMSTHRTPTEAVWAVIHAWEGSKAAKALASKAPADV